MEKLTASVILVFLFVFSTFSFGQDGLKKVAEISKILSQDTTQKKAGTTNLAVSDEGASGNKSKANSSKTQTSGDKTKKDNAQEPANTNSGSGGTNLAVSDEGASGKKDTKSAKRERDPGDTTKTDEVKKAADAPKQP